MTGITGIIVFIELVWIAMTLLKLLDWFYINYCDGLQEQTKKPPHNNYMVDYPWFRLE